MKKLALVLVLSAPMVVFGKAQLDTFTKFSEYHDDSMMTGVSYGEVVGDGIHTNQTADVYEVTCPYPTTGYGAAFYWVTTISQSTKPLIVNVTLISSDTSWNSTKSTADGYTYDYFPAGSSNWVTETIPNTTMALIGSPRNRVSANQTYQVRITKQAGTTFARYRFNFACGRAGFRPAQHWYQPLPAPKHTPFPYTFKQIIDR